MTRTLVARLMGEVSFFSVRRFRVVKCFFLLVFLVREFGVIWIRLIILVWKGGCSSLKLFLIKIIGLC